MQRFAQWRLNAKLMVSLGVALTLTLATMVVAVSWLVERDVVEARAADLHGRNRSLLAGVDALHGALDADVLAQAGTLKAALGELRVADGGALAMRSGTPLAGRFDEVDLLARNPGTNATVFERRGNDFVRITTSVTKADGSRAVGTKLAPDSPAYAAVSAGRTYVGRADLFGKTFAAVYEPILVDGQVVGLTYVGRDIGPAVAALAAETAKTPVGRTGTVVVLDAKGVAKAHPSRGGENLVQTGDAAYQAMYRDALARKSGETVFVDEAGVELTAVFDSLGRWGWTAVAIAPTSELHEVATTAQRALTAAGVALLLVQLALLRTLVGRLATGPLGRLSDEVARAEQGELTLALREHADTADEVDRLETALARSFGQLRTLVGQVREATGQVGAASQQIRVGMQDLSNRTEQQASSLQQTAGSMAAITQGVREGSGRASAANKVAQAAEAAARHGGQTIGQVVSTMEGIAASSARVQEITSVIDGIAFQTNILALNAAVEAARAGEQGRGFAVVASEVRSLAQRSGEAAREIKQLIEDSGTRIAQGTRLVADAGEAVQALVRNVRDVAATIEEISQAGAGQLGGIEQVEQAVRHMDSVTQQNAALVEQTAAATHSLAEQAAALDQAVAVFR